MADRRWEIAVHFGQCTSGDYTSDIYRIWSSLIHQRQSRYWVRQNTLPIRCYSNNGQKKTKESPHCRVLKSGTFKVGVHFTDSAEHAHTQTHTHSTLTKYLTLYNGFFLWERESVCRWQSLMKPWRGIYGLLGIAALYLVNTIQEVVSSESWFLYYACVGLMCT